MQNCALILIDVQKAFNEPDWGQRNNHNAETNISDLLAFWRKKQGTVIHVHHSSKMQKSRFHPSQIGHEPKSQARPVPDEVVFKKLVNSAFIGTELERYLRDNKIEKLTIVGLTTDHCVSTTVRMASNFGFEVTLVSDATATFNKKLNGVDYTAQQIHLVHLASLNNEFCTLATTSDILASG
ncbi:cysteine hydrolase family protein [Pseudoalteromonas denitrificans]|uniref:Nicotinamidase-related amidase n=1 Tax=Pseudoalteromonas denitrificans DSM 6059 TaxID=1123010 RepID=A0A1I1KAJ6_9GAMM|nr:cysteine hydrolase family protein [Pseudoalteromonas denitrificans]SFC57505.1 Nicotinamidase-related amidase [Pseudoalteromonas denitrificans DSM 6059]